MKRHWNDVDAETQDSIQFFYDAAIAQYPIESLILFGSRARGDFDKHSDADVLILMKTNSDDEIDLARIAFVDIAFDVMLKTGILISPLPIQFDILPALSLAAAVL